MLQSIEYHTCITTLSYSCFFLSAIYTTLILPLFQSFALIPLSSQIIVKVTVTDYKTERALRVTKPFIDRNYTVIDQHREHWAIIVYHLSVHISI